MFAPLLSTQYWGERATIGWLVIRIICPSEWGDMSIFGLSFQWESIIKIQPGVLVWFEADSIIMFKHFGCVARPVLVVSVKEVSTIYWHVCVLCSNISNIYIVYLYVSNTTGARGTDHPPFSNFLFTNLFSIKFLYFFFLILTCSCQYSYNLMLTSNCMCRPYIDTNNPQGMQLGRLKNRTPARFEYIYCTLFPLCHSN